MKHKKFSSKNSSSSENKPKKSKVHTNTKTTITHYITDSDNDCIINSPSPPKLPPHQTIVPIINNTYNNSSPSYSISSEKSSQTTIDDPFNQDYQCQYEQEFIDGMEQQFELTPYDSEDLNVAYGQGRNDEYNYSNR